MENESARVQLTDVKGAEVITTGPLSTMSIHVATEPVQEARLANIELELEYRNEGSEDVELLDPIDQIQYMLLDEGGYPLKTPSYAPRLLTQPWDETATGLEGRFSVVSIRDNGREMIVQKELSRRTVTVKSGTGYSITLRIRKIMGQQATPIGIPPGAYRIILTCALVTQSQESPIIRMLQSGSLAVSLE